MYKILEKEYRNKKEITNSFRDILYKDQINDSDKEFILELIKYHPESDIKTKDMSDIIVRDNIYNTKSIYIQYKSGLVDDISIVHCINNIPPEEIRREFIMNFGKYKDVSIYNINDRDYLEWLSKQNIHRSTKIKINKYLKFGFV